MSDDSDDPKPAELSLTTVMNRGRDRPMGFFEHLEEMRWMIIKCMVVFVIFAVIIGYYLAEFNGLLLQPLVKVQREYPTVDLTLGTNSVLEGFNVVIQMCILGGLLTAAPFMLFFIGRFVSPALNEKELKVILPLCVSAFVLFLCGAAFGFYILVPGTLRTSTEINVMFHYTTRWTAGSYFSMLSWLVLGVGGTFEFPLLILLLVWLGIMSTAFLRKYRRHAIVLIVIIAAIVTPTPDPVNMLLMATPLYILFELAILVASRVEKRRLARKR
ncbi:MAG TPA: twin-arginine translocase subunit TatC [Opitutaceae bacterium]|nr:twin-arginine translocase subunit TatC [Opitutaceae bacterium]